MDGKLESLKSLNAMLVKESFERRHEVESLQSQLAQLTELIHKERDEMKAKTKGLEMKLVETDNKLVDIQKEVLKLNVQKQGLVDENQEKDRVIEAMTRDKTSMEKCLAESNWAVDRMKKEIEEVVKDREALEADRNVELKNRNELEKKVSALNEFVMKMQNMETKLRENVAVLEKRFVESVELQKLKAMEINILVQEKRERENNFKRLMEEKGMLMKNFHEATEQLDEHKKMLKEMSQNKYVIEQAKQRGETEINELQKQVANLRASVLPLEECGKGRTEKIQQLETEISHSSDELHRVTNERDGAHKKEKRFWVFIASSAAILAAAAIAYVRGH